MAYTADERETVIIVMDDGSVDVSTNRRTDITALLKNLGFIENEDDRVTENGRPISIHGSLPAGSITIRNKAKGTIKRSDAGKRRGRPANVATCNGSKADGTKCNSIAKGDTGFCVQHQDQAK